MLAIVEDYMIVEYVEFAIPENKMNCNCLMTKNEVCLFSRKFIVYALTCELLVACSWEVLWDELLLWHIIMLEKVIEIIIDQTCAPSSIHTS